MKPYGAMRGIILYCCHKAHITRSCMALGALAANLALTTVTVLAALGALAGLAKEVQQHLH